MDLKIHLDQIRKLEIEVKALFERARNQDRRPTAQELELIVGKLKEKALLELEMRVQIGQ